MCYSNNVPKRLPGQEKSYMSSRRFNIVHEERDSQTDRVRPTASSALYIASCGKNEVDKLTKVARSDVAEQSQKHADIVCVHAR